MAQNYYRRCGQYKYIESDGLCGDCLDLEDAYESASESQDMFYELRQEMQDQKEEYEKKIKEMEEKILDVNLPWYPCSHCGNKTRQDKIKEVDGKKFCGDCASKIRECQFCHKKYVLETRKNLFTKDEKFVKKSSEIEFAKLYYTGDHPYAGKEGGCQYDAIKRNSLYVCPSCYERSRENEKELWATSEMLKVEYNKLKAAKEKADREEEERKEREAERRKREEKAKREIEEAEEKARKEAAEKKFKTNTSAGCLGLILFAIIAIAMYANGAGVAPALIFGGAAFALSMVFRSITSHLFVGLFFATALEVVIGLIISVICYFVWDMFLVPLCVCYVIFIVLFTILSATGVIDINKHSDGSTPFDALEDFFDKFRR